MKYLLSLAMLTTLSCQFMVTNVDYMNFNNVSISQLPFNTFFPEKELHGLIKVKGEDDDMFYWLFPSRSDADKDPLVIWLSGGPGCSSSLAIFHENGPMEIVNGEPRSKEISWNNRANLVFIDQPIGTGYSNGHITDIPNTEDQVAEQFEAFILGFYTKYPDFKGRDLYITGESYAGHYIPFITSRLLQSEPVKAVGVNLKGIAIGNGLVDPYNQVMGYPVFAYQNKLINKIGETALTYGFKFCQLLMKYNIPVVSIYVCNLLTASVLGNPLSPRFNVYDIRKKCEFPPLCYDFSDIDNYLNRKDVQAALGVEGRKWEACNMKVHLAMLSDYNTNAAIKVIDILDKGLKVLIYNGDKDYICNWVGGEMWVRSLLWKGKKDFDKLKFQDIGYGLSLKLDNFEFIRFKDAGHMVPMDKPDDALTMLHRLIYNW